MSNDFDTNFIFVYDTKDHLFLGVDASKDGYEVIFNPSLIMVSQIHVLNHVVNCVVDGIHCEYRENDAGVEFRFEDLPAFSVEENAAFDVAEVGIARC